jgi:pyruvate/2-oxoacid:ferredoxin oxidoreductase beta subunit
MGYRPLWQLRQRFTVNLIGSPCCSAVVLGVAFADVIHHYLFNPDHGGDSPLACGVIMLWPNAGNIVISHRDGGSRCAGRTP